MNLLTVIQRERERERVDLQEPSFVQYHLQNTGGSPAQGKCETVGRGSNCFSPVKEMLSMAGAYVENAHTSAQVQGHLYYKKDIKSHICTPNYTWAE